MSGATISASAVPFASNALAETRFEKVGEGRFIFTAPDSLNTELDLAHVRRERHQLHGELTVRTGLAGVRTLYGVLFSADVNLSTLRGREEVAQAIAARTKTTASIAEWRQLLDDLATCVGVAEREGDPAVLLTGNAPPATQHDLYRVLGFTLPKTLPAMVFGPGDTLKTYTIDALAVEFDRLGVRVGLVDGEMGHADHDQRTSLLAHGRPLNTVAYVNCTRPLIYEWPRVAEAIRTHRLDYLFFDSVGFLAAEKPENAEAALGYFRAVRSLGPIGSLHLAHRAKAEEGDKMPFGSAFWFNSVRALWYAQRAEAGADSRIVDVAYLTRKFNVGRWPAAHGLRFTFDETSTSVAPVEPASVTSLATSLPIKERVRALLRSGPKEFDELAGELSDVKPESLRRTLDRYCPGPKNPTTGGKVLPFTVLADGRYGLSESRYGR